MVTTLVLDMGNSRLKWGLAVGRAWRSLGIVPNEHLNTVMLTDWKQLPTPQRIVGSSVVSEAMRIRLENHISHWHVTPEWLVPSRESCGVKNSYSRPQTLGADRWAALIALRQKQLALPTVGNGLPPPVLHVSFGTAVVVDALDSDGTFLGGMILPSVSVMRQSLATSTAALHHMREGRHTEYPHSTEDAIYSGSLEAIIGMVERWLVRLARRRQIQPDEVVMYVGGGDAGQLADHLPKPHHVVENLVLEGLLIALDKAGPGDLVARPVHILKKK